MRFLYEYRTSDNVRHEGEVCAADREAAFVALKARGIKASRLVEAPGFFNKLFGKGKRWLLIALLSVLVAAAFFVIHTKNVELESVKGGYSFEDMTRRQLIGDTAIIEKGIRTGWDDVFEEEGERFLASFAIPGVPAGLRNTSEAEIRRALARQVLPEAGDYIEARQIKSIVEGMKCELRAFLAGGKHTIVEYGRRLVERQEQEISYYNRAKTEIDAAVKARLPEAELLNLWEARNRELRNIGVRLVPLPEE